MIILLNSTSKSSGLSTLDISTIVISILALGFSLYSYFKTYRQVQKHHQLDLEADYFWHIFSSYLLKKIPQARQELIFHDGKLIGDDSICEHLFQMTHDATYYKYTNPTFYENIKRKAQELEDFIVNANNSQYKTSNEIDSFNGRVNELLEEIYSTISNFYLGKKGKKHKPSCAS